MRRIRAIACKNTTIEQVGQILSGMSSSYGAALRMRIGSDAGKFQPGSEPDADSETGTRDDV